MKDTYVLVTGASSGIGNALAEVFAEAGYNTILMGRRTERIINTAEHLMKKYGTKSIPMTCNLVDKTSVEKCINQMKSNKLDISILVNSAGISNFGEFLTSSIGDEDNIVDLNIKGLLQITKLILPLMMVTQYPKKILNVSSVVGYYALPFQSVYAASKAFVLSFSEALRAELKEAGIQVSVLCPGNVKTEFLKKSGLLKLYPHGIPFELSAGDVARECYKQFMNGTNVIYPQKKLKRMVQTYRFFSFWKSFMYNQTDRQYKNRQRMIKLGSE